MHGCVVGCCRGQPDDQLALLHLHVPRHRRPYVAGGERADKTRMHVATRLVHLMRAEVGVVAPDCSCVVQPCEQWRGDSLASVALHELGSEVPRTVEKEQRQGVRAESGLVDGLARRIPIDARKQAPRPDQVMIEAAHDLQGRSSLAPGARPAVPSRHCEGDDELDHSDQRCEHDIPCRTLLRDLAGELESRSRHPQYAGQESDQDQPEQPSPAAHDADGQPPTWSKTGRAAIQITITATQ